MPDVPTDLSDVIETLRQRRAVHLEAAALLDEAIGSLTKLEGKPMPAPGGPAAPTSPAAPPAAHSKSVLGLVLDLANEANRDWSAEEILVEYKQRGNPLQVQDPMNAVLSALSRAHKRGHLARVRRGRYKARKWAVEDDRARAEALAVASDYLNDQEAPD